MTIFHEFLQVATGSRDTLSVAMDDEKWQQLFNLCKRQALLGIGFSAIEKLHGQGITCPSSLRMKWMALALQIEKRNELLNVQCRVLAEQLRHDGLKSCILKGQGNLLNYPEELRLRRCPGDIDVWCIPPKEGMAIAERTGKNDAEYVTYHGIKAVIEYVRMQYRISGSQKQPRAIYHHIDAPDIEGTEVEMHYKPSFCRSPIRNWKMQRWFSLHEYECTNNMTRRGFAVPTSSVNIVYQMCHLFNHYFHEGIGLRQLMDYYFALKRWNNDLMERHDLQSQRMWSEGLGTSVMSREEVMRTLESFGMGKFAAAVMWVLHEVFDMPTHYYICTPNEKEGRILLSEIMQGGNFGQYDTRDAHMKNGGTVLHAIWKLKRVMRLVSSYPEEALCEPLFRVWHLGWRMLHC